MSTDKKLYIALVIVAALGLALYQQRKKQAADLQAHSLEAAQGELPVLKLSEEQVREVDKVVLTKPGEGDAGAPTEVVLVKQGEQGWALEKPLSAKANPSNVESVLNTLKTLEVKERVASGTDTYGKWGVSDDKALHAVFYKGTEVRADLYFGEDGSRGQMTRVAGKDGVYVVKGYSKYTFDREVSNWRDKTIFSFDEKNVVRVSIDNEHGSYRLDKDGDVWKAKFKKSRAGAAEALKDFDAGKVEDLLRAFKNLTAADFGDGKTVQDVGLEKPMAQIAFELKGGTEKHVLSVGTNAEGSNRWAIRGGSDGIFSVSSLSADWITAEPDKFKKKSDAMKDEEKAPKLPKLQLPAGHP